ncbi:hypothetical protein BKA63DRAFT_524722 [Paraphoma chrysanthemicola]|nr:hypothetical protein BKA63DRAFT_524722 [Paraphoma chrysanthemicola]
MNIVRDQSKARPWSCRRSDLGLQERVEKMAAEGRILDATQTKVDERITPAESQRRHLRAWNEVPWTQVLKLVRPELLQRLGSASKVAQIPYNVQVSLIDRSIVSATKARRLFVTGGGYIGLGPADLKTGDAMCLLEGTRTPSILRRPRRLEPFCNEELCHRNFKSRSKRPLPYIKQRCLICLRDIEPQPEELFHSIEQHCSNCIIRGQPCIYKYATRWYEVIGDCYANDLMDSESKNKTQDLREKHI